MIFDDAMQNSPKLTDAIRQSLNGLDAFKTLTDLIIESVPVNRKSTVHLYEYDDKRAQAQRKRDNKAAEAILEKVKNENYQVTEEDKAVLAKYSGTGGGIVGADGMKGSQYEYYTPTPIAEGMWSMLKELGFNGGKVLDPCGGTGIFGATSPSNSVIDAVELSEVSGMVQKLVNDNEFYTTQISSFEKVAAANPDEIYDAIITNVPFGDATARGSNFTHDPKYQKETLQGYFILRSLEKLKPRGLAAFIVPPSVVTGLDAKSVSVRQRATLMAEFIGAYRLPNEVFGTAAADTMTDVIVFRKFSTEVAEKVTELMEQNQQTLMDAKVQWDVFLEGHWYKGANERFILGDFIAKDPNAHHLSPEGRDRVTSNAAMPELAKMLKKFPKSRIDWDLLNATETEAIVYKNGDTIVQSGQTLRYKNGTWEVLPHNEDSVFATATLACCNTALSAFTNKTVWDDVDAVVDFMRKTSRGLEIPNWLRNTANQVNYLPESNRAKFWNASVAALSMSEVLQSHVGKSFNYLEEYPELSTAIEQIAALANNPPSKLGGIAKDALKAIKNHYTIKGGFSNYWKGDVSTLELKAVNAENSFEGLMYQNQSKWVGLDDAKKVLGEDFNPHESTEYCMSGDGLSVIKADDYYVGNLADFLTKLDAGIEQAQGDDLLIGKLAWQREEALRRVDTIDTAEMNFNLFSPFVTAEEKAEFVKQFVNANAIVVKNDKGKYVVDIEISGSKLSDADKLAKRFGDYLMKGTLTTGGMKFDGYDNMEALRELRTMAVTANTQFDAWVKARPDIMARLNSQSNDATKLQFRPTDDETPLSIAGMNPELKLHGYQCAFVREKARLFQGINGYDVGLGKTFTSLASVQYAHNMGVKKKTIFVVPNSVLSNWKKEVGRAYSDTENCLFVGLRADSDGNEAVKSSEYAADLSRIMENRHSKIFMTYEAFDAIRLKPATVDNFEGYLRTVDDSLAYTGDKKTDEKVQNYLAQISASLRDKKGNVPFLEDMGVDSVVVDEAHLLKNAAMATNFKGAKYLSLSNASKRGIDAQSKLWFIRGFNPLKDGVMLLTATPITNSPLEIYSMLSLAVGHDKLSNLCMGANGADNFMEVVCIKESQDDVTIDGIERITDVFVGLSNVNVLRNAIKNTATIKDAKDVGDQIIVPDAETEIQDLQLGDDIIEMLKEYKGAFRYAIDEMTVAKNDAGKNRGDQAAYEKIKDKFDLSLELVGHPFNLLKNMELLTIDPDLDDRATFFTFPVEQLDLAKKAIAEFNKKGINTKRPRMNPRTTESAVTGTYAKKDDVTGDIKEWLEIHVMGELIDADTRICLDTMDTLEISTFEIIADNLGLTLGVTIPPKLAALIENINKELMNPRGMIKQGSEVVKSTVVKQIIFCDHLSIHNKIRRLLSQKCGIPAGQIATVTGKTNREADEILEVQNGFNANGEENKYRLILANEKAEVGINLQIGTQAIHHLSIGWTPDSLTQRNGRGQRQGNQTEKVNIYFYDADGTFDQQKRAMVERKSDWITSLMSNQSTNKIDIAGGMSREQMEALIESVGDKDAMARLQETASAKEAMARAKSNRDKQLINLTTVAKQVQWLAINDSAVKYVQSALNDLNNLYLARGKIEKRKAETETARAKNKAAITELNMSIDTLVAKIDSSCHIFKGCADSTTKWETIKKEGEQPLGAEYFTQNVSNFSYSSRGKKFPEFVKSASVVFELIESGEINQQWLQNKELAENMIAESAKNFEKQAAESEALPASVVKDLAAGRGILINGIPVVIGAFVVNEDGDKFIAMSMKTTDVVDCVSVDKDGDNFYFTVHTTTINSAKVVYAGTSEYTIIAKELAEVEDKLKAITGNVYLYSD